MKNITIRQETKEDYFNTELMTMRAFWNLHRPGCNEHYLVHILREAETYLPELSRVAELDGEIVASAPMEITIWNEWHCGEITGIEYSENQTLTVGISVKTDAAGAWGKIDDASLSKR